MDLRAPSLAVLVLAGLGMSGFQGCATVEHGTLDDVPVVTEPPGATVTATTGTICTSPCTVSGPRRDSFTITVAKPGYVPQTVTSESRPNAAAIATASALTATLDFPGRVIDVQDGSYATHVPKAVVVKLAPAT